MTKEKRQNKKVVHDHLGNTYGSIKDLCKAYNISYDKFKDRIDRGWSLKDALTKDVDTKNKNKK